MNRNTISCNAFKKCKEPTAIFRSLHHSRTIENRWLTFILAWIHIIFLVCTACTNCSCVCSRIAFNLFNNWNWIFAIAFEEAFDKNPPSRSTKKTSYRYDRGSSYWTQHRKDVARLVRDNPSLGSEIQLAWRDLSVAKDWCIGRWAISCRECKKCKALVKISAIGRYLNQCFAFLALILLWNSFLNPLRKKAALSIEVTNFDTSMEIVGLSGSEW